MQLGSSFRDPSGFVFTRDGRVYRQVNQVYREQYDRLGQPGGLYAKLSERGWMVPHQEVATAPADPGPAYKVLQPEKVPLISYPYEWCFSQLREAALLTLQIQQFALAHGCSLKDATAYNIQFRGWRPVFIDTLSFETYRDGEPWVAYRQFCQHFLAPLALGALKDIRLTQLLRVHLDGIPLDLASKLLPRGSWWNFGLLAHLHLHARSQSKYSDAATRQPARKTHLPKSRLLALLKNLENCVRGLKWRGGATEWGNYYDETNYSDTGMKSKRARVAAFVAAIGPATIWDLGANTGVFTQVALEAAKAAAPGGLPYAAAFDIDPVAVEKNYLRARAEKNERLLPLLLDLTNPSPSLGWSAAERDGLLERGPVDACLALALVHHLAIGNNVPLVRVAQFFRRVTRNLVIEFVPKSDSQVQRMLATREDVFPDYTRAGFEAAFRQCFAQRGAEPVENSERMLYWFSAEG
jgi:ribosomal protein L11 methylase PrmA